MKYALSFVFFFLLAAPAASHDLGQSYIFLRVYDHSIEVRVEMSAPDAGTVLGLNLEPGNRISLEQIGSHVDELLAYVRPRLTITEGQEELNLRYVGFDRRPLGKFDFVLLTFVIEDLERIPSALDVAFTPMFDERADHRNMLVIEHNWKTSTFNNEANVSLIFSPSNTRQTLNLESASVMQGFMGFIRLGLWHIWTGLDHILFLVALILPSVLYFENKQWKPVANFRRALFNIAAIVTCFTIGHSLTLSLATLDVVNLPSRLVESVIAASIVAAALHNIYPRFRGREWAIALVFGLFHGFGFAGILRDIGLESKYMVLSLFGFNAGVEVGQILIIAGIFPFLFLLRNRYWYPRRFLVAGSVLLMAVALFWFTERALDIPLYQYAMKVPGYVGRQLLGSL